MILRTCLRISSPLMPGMLRSRMIREFDFSKRPEDLHSLRSVPGPENRIARMAVHWWRLIQQFLRRLSSGPFPLADNRGRRECFGFLGCPGSARRQQDTKRRPIPRFAIDLRRAAVCPHDTEDGCRKERIEDSRQSFLIPAVRNFQSGGSSGFQIAPAARHAEVGSVNGEYFRSDASRTLDWQTSAIVKRQRPLA